MSSIKRKTGVTQLPKGKPLNLQAILKPNDLIHVPEKYHNQKCIIKFEDTYAYHCYFDDGWHMWINKAFLTNIKKRGGVNEQTNRRKSKTTSKTNVPR